MTATARLAAAAAVCAATVFLPTGATATAPGTPPPCAVGTDVVTADGPVCGVSGNGVTSWLGIRYAAPPTGELRWRAPRPVAPWTEPFPATTPGNLCPQPARQGPRQTNEDCLNLDVRVPRDAGPGPLPVMVQIHGGGFLLFGPHDAGHLAATGRVISVEIHYRLGIMGFFAEEALGPHSGNYAFQDQQAALRWVQRNIARFGGDPHNVTIYGGSAGGSSVCAQTVSPGARGLFHRGISQSGQYNSLFGHDTTWQAQDCKARWPTESEAQRAGARFTAAVGCAQAADVARCLRAVPVERLLAQAGDGMKADSGTIAPVVDGVTIPLSPAEAFEEGEVNPVRLMIGVDRDDVQLPLPDTPQQYEELVRQQYGELAPAVFARYPLERFPEPSAFLAYRTIVADSNSVCPALRTARHLARRLTVYAYQVDDTDSPPAWFLDQSKPNGAFHVSENTFLYLPANVTLTPNQAAYGRQIVAQWTGFARTGNPTVTGTPRWIPYTPTDPAVMSLQPAGDSVLTREIGDQHQCGFWDSVSPSPR
ncbi:carboxylesterase/lipase family protein [Amycolatopsis sp. NPDC059027]|uniref:carboxylesterase/lipase family protein n=1 Tax=unclassified Amycolatopsis TaxID=2618356 RepID=UPI00366CF116